MKNIEQTTVFSHHAVSLATQYNQTNPLLSLPVELIHKIGRLLSQRDAIQYTHCCLLLFNLRFQGPYGGILTTQYWQRVPHQEEVISSLITPQVGSLRVGIADMYPNERVALKKLKFVLTQPLHGETLISIWLKLHTFPLLNTVEIDCRPLSESAIFSLLELVRGAKLPIKNLHFTHLLTSRVSASSYAIFTLLQQFTQLTTLTLSDYQGVKLPAPINQLQSLRHLRVMSDCLMTLPQDMGDLINLRTLLLEGEKIKKIPASIAYLKHLRTLHIHGGSELHRLPNEITALSQLQQLKIVGNGLKRLPDNIGLLNQLYTLQINASRLFDIPVSITQLTALKDLRIISHYLDILPALSALNKLCSLHLDTKNLRVFPHDIKQCTQLRHLKIIGNFADFSTQLNSLNNLRYLTIYSPNLFLFPESIGQLQHLYSLTVNGSFSSLPPTIAQFTQLHTLKIIGDRLTHLPDEIGQLSKLSRLEVSAKWLRVLPETVGLLNELKVLRIIAQGLSKIPDSVTQLSALQKLEINGGCLTTMPSDRYMLNQLHTLIEIKIPEKRVRLNFTYLGHACSVDEAIVTLKSLAIISHLFINCTHLKEQDVIRLLQALLISQVSPRARVLEQLTLSDLAFPISDELTPLLKRLRMREPVTLAFALSAGQVPIPHTLLSASARPAAKPAPFPTHSALANVTSSASVSYIGQEKSRPIAQLI